MRLNFDFLKNIKWSDVGKELFEFSPVLAAALDSDEDTKVAEELSKVVTGYRDSTPHEVINILRGAKKSDPRIIDAIKNLEPALKDKLKENGVNADELVSHYTPPSHDKTKKATILKYISVAAVSLGAIYELINKIWF